MLLAMLGTIALGLTCTMFATKRAEMGFAAAIFWMLFGGQAYLIHTTTWDIYYDIAFASFLGMSVFCMFGAWGLREKRITAGEDSFNQTDDVYIDEEKTDELGNVKTKRRKNGDNDEEEDEFEVAARGSKKRPVKIHKDW